MSLGSETMPGELNAADFNRWRALVEDKVGIYLTANQRTFLAMQLHARIQELGVKSLASYEEMLQGISGLREWSNLIDSLLVQETYFFRHRPSFEFVINYLNERISNGSLGASFDALSVGCASGEEPFSLAMAIDGCLNLAKINMSWGVTGTDVSLKAINASRNGEYGRRSIEELSDNELSFYFSSIGLDRYKVKQRIKDRVCFVQTNVIDIKGSPNVPMDIIFCQNLLIYFKRWRRREILSALADRLKPGGVLVVGVGEVAEWDHPHLERVKDERVLAYKKR